MSGGTQTIPPARSLPWLNPVDAARRYGIVVVFIGLVLALCIASPQFRTSANGINLLRQNAIIGIMAAAMTFAIILGGFDLSVGSVAAAASVAAAKVMIYVGPHGWFTGAYIVMGILGAVVVGVVVGALNGWLIAYLGVNPFVATLGTMTAVRGLVDVYTNATPLFGVPFSFTQVGLGTSLSIPNPFWIFIAIALLLAVALGQTKFGHYAYAIGGNAPAALEMGIDVRRVKFLVYVVTGVCAAVGGLILVGQTATGQPQGALGYELTAIAAVILGGASLSGGHGRMLGTVVGVFLLGVISNGLNLFGVSPFWQPVASGTILVIAVAIDSAAARSALISR